MEDIKILVVDDDIVSLEMMKRIFSIKKYKVDTANSGEEAVNKIKEKAYDIVITDLIMPGIDGFQVIKEVKRILPGAEVIVLTGYADTESAMKSVNLGAYDYIVKPFDIGKLTLIVQRCLEAHQQRNELKYLREELEKKEK